MKKGDILEGKVIKTEFPDKGIVEVEGKRIVVKHALEGQVVSFVIRKKRKDRIEGQLLRVLTPSPLETAPKDAVCRHFGSCGGCVYGTLPYETQLSFKKRQVEDLIERSGFSFAVEEILPSPDPYGYRNKMEFTFGDEEKDGPLALGLHRKNSFYDIVSLKECHIAHPDFIVLLQAMLSYFTSLGSAYYHRMKKTGFLRHLVLRRSAKTGDLLINLVTTTGDTLDADAFVNMLLSVKLTGTIVGILHTLNDGVADVVKSDETRVLFGQDYIVESLLGLRFQISPFSFFQTNTGGAEVLYEKVREYAGDQKDKVIYDLYSGTGTIAQMMAAAAKKVVGVEIVEEAVAAARANAADNGLTNCTFLAGDVLTVVDALTEKPDLIILDPPRDGIHPKALKKIIAFDVEEIVYISCKATSLMRDLGPLTEAGYRVERCCLVDMFPATGGIETVALLKKLVL